jgi:phosphocarrier protein HPr
LNEPPVTEPLKAIARITNKRGLHARASAKIVEAAARFQAEVTIIKDGSRVNARSIMGLMMLAASLGSEIGVEAEGPDQDAAMTAMLALIEAKFGEE